jgi:uncharacterized protein YrrD
MVRGNPVFCRSQQLTGYKLHGRDGDLGKIKEFYFDDKHWTIRYLVADTGTWLASRQVLISPYSVMSIDTDSRTVKVDLTKDQIENSPELDSDQPVSRQFELTYFDYYGWPSYWSGQYMWGAYPLHPYIMRDRAKWLHPAAGELKWDAHLRSMKDVSGHRIEATDGEIGHVVDFIIDDETWAIRYLIIDTTNWWPGGHVLVSPEWIARVSWPDRTVFMNVTRSDIEKSPPYKPEAAISRDYETELHRHYQKTGYWSDMNVKQPVNAGGGVADLIPPVR